MFVMIAFICTILKAKIMELTFKEFFRRIYGQMIINYMSQMIMRFIFELHIFVFLYHSTILDHPASCDHTIVT